MSGFSCKCEGKMADRRKNWVVVTRNGNHSFFNRGFRGSFNPSDYSEVLCRKCGGIWRTKAKYVNELPDSKLGMNVKLDDKED